MRSKVRIQFSLATLFVIVTISAVAAHWYSAKRREREARDALKLARLLFGSGLATDEEVYHASVTALRASLAVPFCDRTRAYSEHLELMRKMEREWRALPPTATPGRDPREFQREGDEHADKVVPWIKEAEQWLRDGS